MINTLKLQNFQGHERTLAFSPFTIVTGRNASGKTAVKNGLLVATLGKHPDLAQNNKAQLQLATDPTLPMIVEATTDTSTISRTWKMKGKAGVDYTYTGPVDGTDQWEPWLISSLKPEAFISANNKQRLAMIAHLAGGRALEELATTAAKANKMLRKPLAVDPDALTFAELVAKAFEEVGKNAGETKRRYEQTLQGLTDMALKAGQPKKEIKDELAAAQRKQFQCEATAKEAKARMDAMNKADQAAEDARSSGEQMPAELLAPDIGERIARGPELSRAVDEAETAEGRFKQILDAATKVVKDLTKERDDLSKGLGGISASDLDSLSAERERIGSLVKPNLAPLWEAYQKANREATEAQSRVKVLKERADAKRAELAGFSELKCCPTCQAAAKGWKDKVLDFLTAEEAKASKELQEAEALVGPLVVAVADTSDAHAAAQRVQREIDTLPTLDNKVEGCLRLSRLAMKIHDAQQQAQRNEEAYNGAAELTQAAHGAMNVHNQLVRLNTKWAGIKAIYDAAPKPADHEAAIAAHVEAEGAVEQAKQAVAELEAAKKASDDAEGFQSQIKAATTSVDEATAQESEAKSQAKALRTAMDAAVQTAYAPILKACVHFLHDMAVGDVTVSDGELGAFVGGHWKPFELLSGTEQIVALAAVQAALTAQHGGCLILDELSRIDRINKHQFARNLRSALSMGTLAQVLVLDHDAGFWKAFAGEDGEALVVEL